MKNNIDNERIKLYVSEYIREKIYPKLLNPDINLSEIQAEFTDLQDLIRNALFMEDITETDLDLPILL